MVCGTIHVRRHIGLLHERVIITDLHPRFLEALEILTFSSLIPRLSRKSVAPNVMLTHACKQHIFETGRLPKTAAACDPAEPVIIIATDTSLDLVERTETKPFEEPRSPIIREFRHTPI